MFVNWDRVNCVEFSHKRMEIAFMQIRLIVQRIDDTRSFCYFSPLFQIDEIKRFELMAVQGCLSGRK